MNENVLFEIVKSYWCYTVWIGEFNKDIMKWKKEYTLDRSFKTLEWAENYVLRCKWLYEKDMSHEDVVQKLKKCLSYRSYEKLYINKK